jgi:hypothetical protein
LEAEGLATDTGQDRKAMALAVGINKNGGEITKTD